MAQPPGFSAAFVATRAMQMVPLRFNPSSSHVKLQCTSAIAASTRYAPSQRRHQRPRPVATHAFDISAEVSGALAVIGSAGIIGGTAFASLWILEKQAVEALNRKVEMLKSTIADKDELLRKAQGDVEKAQEDARENDLYRKRYEDSARDNLKLERALEMKDGQLETFMAVARRQIKYLEDEVKRVKDLG